jgi:branched-chain amino acid aminotransferase
MSIEKSDYIWFDGEFVPWDEAKVHVMAHVLHYGSSVFEGIRCYQMSTGPAIFRLPEHVKRLFNSCKVYRMEIPFSPEQISKAICETVVRNGHQSCYLRPLVFRGYGELGVDPRKCPVQVMVATLKWGAYLGTEALEQGIEAGVSSWRRMAPDTFPAGVKSGGHYNNSQLIHMEATDHGYTEGIALDINGYVAEGSGENVFIVRDGVLMTPPLYGSVLSGITRDSLITLAREQGYTVSETPIAREMLYTADEAFFSGTAAEITPIRAIDGLVIGSGRRGPVTGALQGEFFKIVSGQIPDRHHWMTPVQG